MISNDVIKTIKARRAIRSFKPEQIAKEELETVLDAGTWASALGYPIGGPPQPKPRKMDYYRIIG